MKPLLKYLLVIAVCALPVLALAQDPTWSKNPDPTFNNTATPDKVKIGDSVSFQTLNAQDFDTKTTYSGCDPGQTLVADNVGGEWLITQAGVTGTTVKPGLTASVDAEAWVWSASSGETGAAKTISGMFFFDDGREEDDPRHDTHVWGGASSIKLIPDDKSAEWTGNCSGNSPEHLGSQFAMTVRNEDHPTFSFSGMTVQEEIIQVICDVQYNAELAELLMEADDSWTLGAGNTFVEWHSAGEVMFALFDLYGNELVSLGQIYKITSGGWPSTNPDHAVGQKGGFLGFLQAVHFVRYTRERISPKFFRATKLGVTCEDSP